MLDLFSRMSFCLSVARGSRSSRRATVRVCTARSSWSRACSRARISAQPSSVRAAWRRRGAAKRAQLGVDARYAAPKEARAISPDDVEDEGLLRARLERYESNREQASLLTSAAARGGR